jgi:hypothetical protein
VPLSLSKKVWTLPSSLQLDHAENDAICNISTNALYSFIRKIYYKLSEDKALIS